MSSVNNFEFYFIILIMSFIIIISITLYQILKSPFHFPYFEYYFDVTGKKNPKIEDLIDTFLIKKKFAMVIIHKEKIKFWKKECQDRINKSIIKNYRLKQYLKCLDEGGAYKFYIIRQQTRYHQVNYVKESYKVDQIMESYHCSYEYLNSRNELLKKINYESTINDYKSNNQRRLMTKKLRRKVMIRDNYTCQSCGKYMPDEVGLHIDHIIPISKGGKTVISNLQVLCSKCNGKKSNK